MPRYRLVLLLAAASIAATPFLAGAAPAAKPTVSDPSGDARILGAGYDILSAGLSTTGTTKKVGKKTVYTPTKLVASVTFAGTPSSQLGSSVDFMIDTTACDNGFFEYTYRPGNPGPIFTNEGDLFVSGCGDSSSAATGPAEFFGEASPVIKGNTISWTLPLKLMGSDLPLGTTFSNFRVRADVSEPFTYLGGTPLLSGVVDDGSIDNAYGAGPWVLR